MSDREMADCSAAGCVWLLAQVRPNALKLAVRNLERQGYVIFVPFEEVEKLRGRKRVIEVKPLFPGYIFVQLDLATDQWRPINSTLGIARLVCFDPNVPAQVPLSLIEGLKARCDTDGKLLPPSDLAPGNLVRMNKGPFADYIATIEQLLPNQRVWVLLDVLGKKTRVKASLTDLGQQP